MLAKNDRELAAAEKKLQALKRKEAAAAAAAAAGQKRSKKTTSKASKKTPKKAPNPYKKATLQRTKSTKTAPPKNLRAQALPAASIDLAAAGPATHSRSGRALSRPTRFDD